MAEIVSAYGPALSTLFSVLYAAVKKPSTSLQLIVELRSNLDSLGPLIREIKAYNSILDREDKDLREAKQQLQEGLLLYEKVAKVKSFEYNKKNKYTKKLVILNKSITTWLERLRVQASNLRMELLMREQIDEQRRANERYESTLINTADPVVELPHEPDNQIQLADQVFLRRIQNWVVNRSSYGLWAILVILFSVIMVLMTAGGSAGTKWVILNVGINHLGINNY